jgi:hypothetical protein
LVHLAGTALRHHHEAAARQILDRGAAGARGLDQFHGGNVSVDVKRRDLARSGEKVINAARRGRCAGPVRREHQAGFSGLIARLERRRAVIAEVRGRERLDQLDVGRILIIVD